MNTTPGQWIVQEDRDKSAEGTYLHKVIAVGPEGNVVVALVPSMADAALQSAAPEMMELLIWIHEQLNKSKKPVSIAEFNERFGDIGEKISAESGEL